MTLYLKTEALSDIVNFLLYKISSRHKEDDVAKFWSKRNTLCDLIF